MRQETPPQHQERQYRVAFPLCGSILLYVVLTIQLLLTPVSVRPVEEYRHREFWFAHPDALVGCLAAAGHGEPSHL